jgi:hypothetical protein
MAASILAGCDSSGPDLSGVTGSGSSSDPYVLPAENQPGVAQGIEDYLEEPGSWQFPYDDLRLLVEGTTIASYGDIVYDTTSDEWTVKIGGVAYVLTLSGPGSEYASGACGGVGTCVELSSFDENPMTSQYGTFGAIHVDDGTDISVAQIYYGLKTPVADMPAGSATYNGNFEGEVVLSGGATYDAISTATITVDFDVSTVSLSTTGDVTDSSSAMVGTYLVNGTALISGNSYTGSAVGRYTPDIGSPIDFDTGGMMEGAFYGPAADETAGAVKAESAGGDLLYGGFWGAK